MRGTPLMLLGLGLLSLSLLAFLLADTGAEVSQATVAQCADWWCAKRNRFPVGAGILCGGLGIVFVGIGLAKGQAPPAAEERAATRQLRRARHRGDR